MNQDTDSPPDPTAGSGSRKTAIVLAALIVGSLLLYLVGDRLTPCT
jgi:hypothetical protein